MLQKLTFASMLFCLNFAFAANPFSNKLNERQITQLLLNTNETQIQISEMAKEKAKKAEVKKYAELMVTDHKKHNEELKKLQAKLKIDPQTHVKTERVEIKSDKDFTLLKMKDGKEFDRAYIKTEIDNHEILLKNLDKDILPNVKTKEYKAYLTHHRSVVSGHLKQAKEVKKKL